MVTSYAGAGYYRLGPARTTSYRVPWAAANSFLLRCLQPSHACR